MVDGDADDLSKLPVKELKARIIALGLTPPPPPCEKYELVDFLRNAPRRVGPAKAAPQKPRPPQPKAPSSKQQEAGQTNGAGLKKDDARSAGAAAALAAVQTQGLVQDKAKDFEKLVKLSGFQDRREGSRVLAGALLRFPGAPFEMPLRQFAALFREPGSHDYGTHRVGSDGKHNVIARGRDELMRLFGDSPAAAAFSRVVFKHDGENTAEMWPAEMDSEGIAEGPAAATPSAPGAPVEALFVEESKEEREERLQKEEELLKEAKRQRKVDKAKKKLLKQHMKQQKAVQQAAAQAAEASKDQAFVIESEESGGEEAEAEAEAETEKETAGTAKRLAAERGGETDEADTKRPRSEAASKPYVAQEVD